MATNLPGGICVALYDVCLVRAGRLDASCAPIAGVNAGLIMESIVSLQASPNIKQNPDIVQEDGCGRTCFKLSFCDQIQGWNLTGDLCYSDYEAAELLFGGTLILGAGTFATKSIGYATPDDSGACPNPISFEVVTKAGGAGVGACSPAAAVPPYVGHIFPRTFLTLGQRTFQKGMITTAFTGKSESNPNWGHGPFSDWQTYATGAFPANSGYVQVGYGALPLAGLAAQCGYQVTPAIT